MAQDLTTYRQSEREQTRIFDLFSLLPPGGSRALDVGARDGYLSLLMAERFDHVVALDLVKPSTQHPRVEPVEGDASALAFADGSFEAVLCAEVLEHIPLPKLEKVCNELVRVASRVVVIGVPYREDLRVARTLCLSCGRRNPPWGHVNSFDEQRLVGLFRGMSPVKTSFVGASRVVTSGLSAFLMDVAGNPYGTYEQEECCVHCGAALVRPKDRNVAQKLATKLAHLCDWAQNAVTPAQRNWIHVRFEKLPASAGRAAGGP